MSSLVEQETLAIKQAYDNGYLNAVEASIDVVLDKDQKNRITKLMALRALAQRKWNESHRRG